MCGNVNEEGVKKYLKELSNKKNVVPVFVSVFNLKGELLAFYCKVCENCKFKESPFPLEHELLNMCFNDELKIIVESIIEEVDRLDDLVIKVKTVKISSLLKKIKELSFLQEELEAIIESSYDGIYVSDCTGKTLRINKAYERITGIKKDEVIGRRLDELKAEGYFSEIVYKQVVKEKRPVTILQKIKNEKEVVVTGNPVLDNSGEVKRVVTNVRDISELNMLRRELAEVKEKSKHYQRKIVELQEKLTLFCQAQQDFKGFIIKSPLMKDVIYKALRVARTDTTVLIIGESGTGKEVIARFIHFNSLRKDKAFLPVNCGAIPENLMESEFFGYEPGAFTGALKTGKMGFFELAQGGTLFLDEVGELPLHLQVKLLRALQTKEIMRLGSTKPIKVDVRIIAATNRNLAKLVEEGKFREDLYYRLNVISIEIPPLRKRKEEIIPMAMEFLTRINEKYGSEKKFTREVLEILKEYKWPGNIRELENVIEHAYVVSQDEINVEDLPIHLDSLYGEPGNIALIRKTLQNRENITLDEAISLVEKKLIEDALLKYGTETRAASVLGVNQSTISRKIKKYNIDVKKIIEKNNEKELS
ncbi:sigma-54-dependent transcriptional regulator [Carboxydothermus hydrogenoformans Z-2901]|uniref:HTH-type transcriptional regulatory protein TyrR n=2 Tax=Carboxydothermus hydrogenoformans TaxID=129958 RepID=Q3ACI2_CARHZ|nr:sigma-54-dependent transcriptional regulator [Carboxydothermus hydrogenoformans Z-2901]